MSLTRSVAHNTAVQITGKIISTILGLAAVAIMTRSLGLEQFGWYATAVGFLQFLGILADCGFTVTISNMLSEPKFEERAIINTVSTWRVITATVLQLILPLTILLFPYPAPIKIAVLITSLSFWASSIGNVLVGWYRVKLQMYIVTLGEVLGRIILVAGIGFAALTHAGFLFMMAAISLASLANSVYLFIKIDGFKLALDKNITRDLFIKMWPTALAVIFNSFYLQGDRVILPLYVNSSEVGLYMAAYRVLDVVIQISAMVMGIVMPLITFAWSRNLLDEFKRRYQLGFDLLTLILLPLAAGGIAIATPLMRFVAGKEFSASGYILAWLSVSIIGTCFGMIFGHIALAINRQKQTLWIYLTDAILSVIGYFIFIPRYGLTGAIGVTIFSEFYAGLFLAIITIYYSKTFPHLFNFIKIILASALMGVVVYYFQPLNLFLSILIGILIYNVLILLLRIISAKTLRDIISLKKEVATIEQI